jgi:hypothetical protein
MIHLRRPMPRSYPARPPRAPLLAVSATALVFGLAGCGANGDPLGGPHGGTTQPATPGPENLEGPDGDVGSTEAGGDAASLDGGGAVTGDGASGSGPTWKAVFSSYLATCQTCHNEMNSAGSAYTWLRSQGYIAGTSSALVNPAQSCLAWYGGNMPPGGTTNAAAVADMNAWAAAGALYN